MRYIRHYKKFSILKELREHKGIKQSDLAKQLGVSKQYISEIENNENPSRHLIEKYLKWLDLPFACYIEILETTRHSYKKMSDNF